MLLVVAADWTVEKTTLCSGANARFFACGSFSYRRACGTCAAIRPNEANWGAPDTCWQRQDQSKAILDISVYWLQPSPAVSFFRLQRRIQLPS